MEVLTWLNSDLKMSLMKDINEMAMCKSINLLSCNVTWRLFELRESLRIKYFLNARIENEADEMRAVNGERAA